MKILVVSVNFEVARLRLQAPVAAVQGFCAHRIHKAKTIVNHLSAQLPLRYPTSYLSHALRARIRCAHLHAQVLVVDTPVQYASSKLGVHLTGQLLESVVHANAQQVIRQEVKDFHL